jgi:hypothetical protein
MKLLIFITTLLLFTSGFSDDWKLVKEEKNIKVFIRKPDNSKYEQIRIISKTQSQLSEIVNALEDVNHHKDWVYATEESYIINKTDVSNFDYYVTIDMPFPVKDRDLVIRYKRTQDPNSKVVTINSVSAPGIKAEVKSLVRIKEFETSYKLTPLENGWVEIDYFLTADPGGSLPAWVVNLVTTKGPLETMRSLFVLLENGEYKNAQVEGIVN